MKRLVSIFVPFLLVLGATVPLLSAQGVTFWTPPVLLGDGWWESITVDRHGTVYVGWYGVQREEIAPDNFVSADLFVIRSRSLNGDWSDLSDILYTGVGGYTVRNSLVAAPNGMLYAALRTGVGHNFSSSFSADSLHARNWSNMRSINSSGYYVDQLVDADGVIYLVTGEHNVNLIGNPNMALVNQEQYECLSCSDLIFRRSDDSGDSWTSPVNLSNTFDSGSDRMDIWQGASSRIYVNWDEGSDWYIGRGRPVDARLRYSEDKGETWSEPIIFDGDGSEVKRPIQLTVTEIANEQLLAVWRYSNDEDAGIYYQLSDDLGATWTEPEAIPNIMARRINDSPLDDYELVTDNVGIAHLFAVARPANERQAPPSLYALEYRQGRWLLPRVVMSGEDSVWPEWPKAAVGPQNDIHLSWFVRRPRMTREGLDLTAGLQVYYSYRNATNPDAPTQAFVPTVAPSPAAVATRAFEATPTPFPTVQPVEVVNLQANSDIYATRILVGGLLSSLVLCGVVLVAVGFRPRR